MFWSVITAVVGGVLSKSFNYKAVEKMKLSRYILLEQVKPMMVFIGAIVFLNKSLTIVQLASGFVIILCVYIVFYIDTKNKTKTAKLEYKRKLGK